MSDLYRGARLAGAVELAEAGRAELNATKRAFTDAGVAEGDRERRTQQRVNRRLRGLLAGAGVLPLVAIAAGILSVVQHHKAHEAEAAAKQQALTSDAERVGALALSAPTLQQSMLFGVAGVELADSVQARGALLAALRDRVAGRTALPAAFACGVAGRDLSRGEWRNLFPRRPYRRMCPGAAPAGRASNG